MRLRRHKRVRAKVKGTPERPRLAIFKSNQYIYVQVIDDIAGNTLVSARDLNEKDIDQLKTEDMKGKIAKAYAVGQLVAKRALEKGVKSVVFDRGGYRYYGRVKAVAEGARQGGLQF